MKSDFRRDIQGLRTIAVALVVLYHAGLAPLKGGYVGVDVFFVISGYLISKHLMNSLRSENSINFKEFYARRALRILPTAFFVILLTVVASLLLSPPLTHAKMALEAAATAFYVPNVLFALQDTNYLTEESPSAFQHYWSLGIEEQFYLVWPLLLFLFWRLTNRSLEKFLLMVAAVVVTSFFGGLYFTWISQPWAFFSLPTRAWELGIGSLISITLALNLRPPKRVVAEIVVWLGLLLICAAAFIFDENLAFPGYLAAIPVIGAALIIWGGDSTQTIVSRALSARFFQYIGERSYSIYLWHWPLLIIGASASSVALAWQVKSLLVFATFLLSMLSFRYVEEPFRKLPHFKKQDPWIIFGGSLAISCVIGVLCVATTYIAKHSSLFIGKPAKAFIATESPISTGFVPKNLRPSLQKAAKDLPALYGKKCHADYADTAAKECVFGETDSNVTYVLFGDSHAAHWQPALETLARERRAKLVTYTKSSCPSVEVDALLNKVPYTACSVWRENVFRRIQEINPDLVVISNFQKRELGLSPEETRLAWQHGIVKTVDRLPSSSRVALIADTPVMAKPPAVCLSANLDKADICSQARDKAFDRAWQVAERSAIQKTRAMYVDMTNFLCTVQTCPPIIGDVLVYRDSHHLTATVSSALGLELGKLLNLN